jgi:predicted Zn-dependent peptidase
MRSDLIDQLEAPIDRASVLAHATLFDGNPDRLNKIPSELAGVTPAEVKAFAAKYLVAKNRTVLQREPVAASEAERNPGGAQ